jgi:hypothetical protein
MVFTGKGYENRVGGGSLRGACSSSESSSSLKEASEPDSSYL